MGFYDGREFHCDAHRQYGLIVRYAPDRELHAQRRWFIIGGLSPEATIGAGWYLAQHWRHLASCIPADQDFAAVISVPALAPTGARLREADICLSTPSAPKPTQRADRQRYEVSMLPAGADSRFSSIDCDAPRRSTHARSGR